MSDTTEKLHRKETRPPTRWMCDKCGNHVTLYVPVLAASCNRCGRRLVKKDTEPAADKRRTA